MSSHSELTSDVSVETASQHWCWLIPITVKGIRTVALIDTGASMSMMGLPLFQKVQQVSWMRLQTHETPWVEGVGSNPVPTLGQAEVEVGIGDGMYKATVVVGARKERPNFIISDVFLTARNCDLPLRQKLFTIGKQEIQCVPAGIRANYN